jgi:cbb3-type cytochrome c oxidase subunit III
MKPGAFLRPTIRKKSRRCRINASAQTRSLLVSFAALFVFGLVLSGCRQDMHNQPKFIPLRPSDFYADRRSAREPIAGTIARGELKEDTYFYTGKRGNDFGNDLPFPLTAKVLARGQERYDIYCTPCHSRIGDGGGMIVQRGFKRPPSFHTDRLRDAPLGHFFDVMSNGFGGMPDYQAQVAPQDRWAIAAYIRVLQLSQNATEADAGQIQPNASSQNGIRLPDNSKNDLQPVPQPQRGGEKP